MAHAVFSESLKVHFFLRKTKLTTNIKPGYDILRREPWNTNTYDTGVTRRELTVVTPKFYIFFNLC